MNPTPTQPALVLIQNYLGPSLNDEDSQTSQVIKNLLIYNLTWAGQ